MDPTYRPDPALELTYRDEVRFRMEVIRQLTELGTNMRSLVGNGQPGRIAKIESRLSEVERWVWRASGIAVVVVLFVNWLVHG